MWISTWPLIGVAWYVSASSLFSVNSTVQGSSSETGEGGVLSFIYVAPKIFIYKGEN